MSSVYHAVLVQRLLVPELGINGVEVMGNRVQRKQTFAGCYPVLPWESSRAGCSGEALKISLKFSVNGRRQRAGYAGQLEGGAGDWWGADVCN